MSQNTDDAGVVQALLDRFNTQRFPRAMALKEKVDRGEKLETFEADYLAEILADARSVKALLARHPEYEDLVLKVMNLYTEITRKALENESK